MDHNVAKDNRHEPRRRRHVKRDLGIGGDMHVSKSSSAAGELRRCDRKTMAADQGNVVVVDGWADRISDLPDHLLHRILICLPSTADAARTSVLSRRWRRVWTHLPELTFHYCCPERVDAALAAWSAPVLHRLEIAATSGLRHVTAAEHVCWWLRFASECLAGELRLWLPWHKEVIVLPVRGRFTAISFAPAGYILHLHLRFQLHPAGGVFTALVALTIKRARLENHELEQVVSSRCPRLKELVLQDIILQMSRDHIISIRSDSLEKLRVAYAMLQLMKDGRRLQLQVATPELQELSLCLCSEAIDARIAAPKLSKVCWREFYDPRRHQLVEAGRHLKRLELTSRSLALLGRFDAVDELDLDILLSEGAEEYRRILEETNKIIKCEALLVTFSAAFHAYQPLLLHLLQKCLGLRKLVVRLSGLVTCKLSSCPCHLAHNRLITNGIVLDSLQEILVEHGGAANQIVKLMSLLCRCSGTFQKKVHIIISSKGNRRTSWYTRRKIDILLAADPNDKVEVTIH